MWGNSRGTAGLHRDSPDRPDVSDVWDSHQGGGPMIRNAVVAGQFYPAEAHELRSDVEGYIEGARIPADVVGAGAECRGLIVPHAGYVYSGPVAGGGYACLASLDKSMHTTVGWLLYTSNAADDLPCVDL